MTDTRKTMQMALEVIEMVQPYYTQNRHVKEAIEALRTELARVQEPIANAEQASAFLESKLWEVIDMHGAFPEARIDSRTLEHLMCYAPQPTQEPAPERQPLTKTRIGNALRKLPNGDVGMYRNGFKDGAKYAEAAHGIGAKT